MHQNYIRRSYSPISLLTSCVPYLSLNNFSVNFNIPLNHYFWISSIYFVAKSTPIVLLLSRLNSSFVKRERKFVFPTPESPIKTTVKVKIWKCWSHFWKVNPSANPSLSWLQINIQKNSLGYALDFLSLQSKVLFSTQFVILICYTLIDSCKVSSWLQIGVRTFWYGWVWAVYSLQSTKTRKFDRGRWIFSIPWLKSSTNTSYRT